MNVLVTGGCGFIGSNLVKYLRKNRPQWKVVNLDKLTYAGNLENLTDLENDPQHVFVRGDIGNRELVDHVIRTHKIDAIMHLAAESHVDRSILGPEAFIVANVLGTNVLLEAARHAKLSRFLMVSTDEVYGSLGPTGLFTETTPLDPSSPYSSSKAAADLDHPGLRAHLRARRGGHPLLNNYGPYQFPEKLIPLMVANAHQRQAAAGLRRRHQRARLAARGRSLRRAHPRPREGQEGRVLQHRRQLRAAEHPDRQGDPRGGGQARVAHQVRQGPPRSRPALRHRRVEEPARAGLGAFARLRAGAGATP